MKIDAPLRDLGEVPADDLREAVLGLDDAAWADQQYRQETYEVHRQTESLVMVFTDGSGWPEIEVRKESGWDWLMETAVPVMHHIIQQHYAPGGVIIRAMAARMAPGAVIRPHRDSHPSFHASHRIHIPLVTNPRVRFTIDGRPYLFEVGKAYEINNQLTHSVMNKGSDHRVHFIFDYLPPGARAPAAAARS
jgi:quercetin dioxygenase-like cupin family protein